MIYVCSDEEDRWPTSLALRIITNGASGKRHNRATGFPPFPGKEKVASAVRSLAAQAPNVALKAYRSPTVDPELRRGSLTALETSAKAMFQVRDQHHLCLGVHRANWPLDRCCSMHDRHGARIQGYTNRTQMQVWLRTIQSTAEERYEQCSRQQRSGALNRPQHTRFVHS
jgi:hypothetical protein